MISAPCARLTMLSTPHTSASPSAISAYSPPSRTPLTRICSRSSTTPPAPSALVPGGQRVLQLADELAALEDRDDLVVLDLDHHLRQADLPGRAELDASVHAFEVDLGERVAHLRVVGAGGSLDRLDESLDHGDPGGHVVVGVVAVARLPRLRELLGVADPRVLQRRRRQI